MAMLCYGFMTSKEADKERSSLYEIDCSADPADPRPAVDIICDRITELLSAAPGNKPVVVLMGEAHVISAHTALQQTLMARLIREGIRFSVNIEAPGHNLFPGATTTPGPEKYQYYDLDAGGRVSLLNYLTFKDKWAALSHDSLCSFCYRGSISTRFNDTANDSLGSIDRNDPYTADILKDYPEPKDKTTSTSSPLGVAIRNRVMVKRALDHARDTKTRLLLQIAGRSHVFGDDIRPADSFKHEDSLSSLFTKAGAFVLPVYIETQPLYHLTCHGMIPSKIPPEAKSILKESVVIRGLSEQQFLGEDDIQEELKFLIGLENASGGEYELLPAGPLSSPEKTKACYSGAARAANGKIMLEARTNGRTGLFPAA